MDLTNNSSTYFENQQFFNTSYSPRCQWYEVDFLPNSKRWYNVKSRVTLKQTMLKKKVTSNSLIINKIVFITSLLNDRHYSKPFISIHTFNPQNNSILLLLSNFQLLIFHIAFRFPFFFFLRGLHTHNTCLEVLFIRCFTLLRSPLKDGTPNL